MFFTYQIYDDLDENVNFQLDYYKSDTPSSSFDAERLEKYELYSILWLKSAKGNVQIDFQDYTFPDNTMLYLFPEQYFNIDAAGQFEITRISFLRDFFCVKDNNPEVLCNGVLFNHVYAVAHIILNDKSGYKFSLLHQNILSFFKNPFLADKDQVKLLLKKWLLLSVECWLDMSPFDDKMSLEETDTLFLLKKTIDKHFLDKLSIVEYADLLNVSDTNLSRLIKKRIDKTISQLVNNRIILEAKRMLVFTEKSVKQIAFDLLFNDVAYFVRFFKNHSGVTPEIFRNKYGQEPNSEYYESILTLIEENFMCQHNVQFYADELDVTAKTLLEQAKKKWNRTISDLIKNRLLLESKRLLFFTDKKVKDIAIELQFTEPSAFSNFFKQHHGVSPDSFRNSWKNNHDLSIAEQLKHFGTFDWVNKF